LEYGEAFLDNILTMGESNVPLLTPQPKMTTSQGLTKSMFCYQSSRGWKVEQIGGCVLFLWKYLNWTLQETYVTLALFVNIVTMFWEVFMLMNS